MGQSAPDAAGSRLRQIYLDEIAENAQLYNGPEYIRNGQRAIGFPFFESNDLLSGSVSYRGVEYPSLRLQYDLTIDELIAADFDGKALMRLEKKKIDSFLLDGHRFIKFTAAATNGLLKDGYYEELSNGSASLYVKRIKKLNTPVGYEDFKYLDYNYFFLRTTSGFHAVGSRDELLDLLADKKDQLKKFIHVNKLNFRKKPEEAFTKTVVYYSQITP
ncbi:MAG TPA: hypothetical protein VG890_13415 [Puia sp.]|nr:hypothetical protein [Puia sp.]